MRVAVWLGIWWLATGLAWGQELTPQVLPRLVIGQIGQARFQTTFYFHNPGEIAAVATLVAFTEDGSPFFWAPDTGGSPAASRTFQIPAGGTVVIRPINDGPGNAGWARLIAPAGVTGYGVYRQVVPGRPDQEAVVPFRPEQGRAATLIFDEMGFTTGVAVTNSAEQPGTLTVTAKDVNGAPLATVTLPLGSQQSVANVLSLLAPALAPLAGRRGSVVFRLDQGVLSVAALRFLDQAFGSIPATHQ
jgi:hypothetical protein